MKLASRFIVLILIPCLVLDCNGFRNYYPNSKLAFISPKYDLSFQIDYDESLDNSKYSNFHELVFKELDLKTGSSGILLVSYNVYSVENDDPVYLYAFITPPFLILSLTLLPFNVVSKPYYVFTVRNGNGESLKYTYKQQMLVTILWPVLLRSDIFQKTRERFKYSLMQFLTDIENDPKFIEFYKRSQKIKK